MANNSWTIKELDPNRIIIKDAIGRPVCSIDHPHWDTRGMQNAVKIAAIPDLLNALKECVTEEGANGRREGLGRQIRRLDAINEIARQAIAKAEGGAV